MSDWARLVGMFDDEDWLALCNDTMLEIQTEQRRKDAETLKRMDVSDGPYTAGIAAILKEAANTIYPEGRELTNTERAVQYAAERRAFRREYQENHLNKEGNDTP